MKTTLYPELVEISKDGTYIIECDDGDMKNILTALQFIIPSSGTSNMGISSKYWSELCKVWSEIWDKGDKEDD